MDTQQRLAAIAEADPSYKIATVGELRKQQLLQPGDLEDKHVLQGGFLSDDTFAIYYQDGEYVDLHEMHNDYDALVAVLYDFLECDC
ncbi:hypothetical protein D3C87_1098980 [compost metagenome]